jgi:predicted RNA-binding protein YlqC (UPF0109 family)
MTVMSSIDQQFIEFVVKSLVSKPDAVQVDRRIDEKGVLLELTVDPEDLGRVIGKRGATAQSMRTLLRALGTKNDARYNLKIIDNGVPQERHEYAPPQPAVPLDDSSSSDDFTSADEPELDSEPSQEAPTQEAPTTEETPSDDPEDEQPDDQSSNSSDRHERTRKELQELDDLDV